MIVALLLDVIRAAVITIVELRKFEIRKRSKAGDFVVRKVQKQDDKDGLPALLKPKPKIKAKTTSATPKVAPKFSNMERPKFLPDIDEGGYGGPPMLGPPGTPGGRTPPGGGTPMGGGGKGMMPPPPPPGARTPPGGARTPPKVPFGQASPMAQRGDQSPAGSQASRISQSLTQSLADRRGKGNITPPGGGMKGAPPPPPGMGGKGQPRPPMPPGGSRSPRSSSGKGTPPGSGKGSGGSSGARGPPR